MFNIARDSITLQKRWTPLVDDWKWRSPSICRLGATGRPRGEQRPSHRMVSKASASDGSFATGRPLAVYARLRSHRFSVADRRLRTTVRRLPAPPRWRWRGRRVRVHDFSIRRGRAVVVGRILIGRSGQTPKVGIHRVSATKRLPGVRWIAHRWLPSFLCTTS